MSSVQPKHLVVLAITAIIYTYLISIIGYGHDYCVHYYAAKLFWQGQSPYGMAANTFLAHTCDAVSDGAGSAYPIPFLIIIAPMTWLPFITSAILWTLSGTLLLLLAWLLVAESPKLITLIVLFLPCYQVISIGQSTLHWFGLSVVLIFSIQRRWWFVAGCCMALLIWKPQAGLIFALAGCWWAWRRERRALVVMLCITFVFLIWAFMLFPNWIDEWLKQIRNYSNIVPLRSYALFVPVLVFTCWNLPWWTKVAAVQALLFPVGNPYMVLPLLLIWLSVGGWTALIGASLSYFWPVLPYSIHWYSILAPICLVTAYHSWILPRLRGGPTPPGNRRPLLD